MEDFFPQDRHIFVIYSKKCNKIVLLFCRPSIMLLYPYSQGSPLALFTISFRFKIKRTLQ